MRTLPDQAAGFCQYSANQRREPRRYSEARQGTTRGVRPMSCGHRGTGRHAATRIPAHLRTGGPQGLGGSNPSPSVLFCSLMRRPRGGGATCPASTHSKPEHVMGLPQWGRSPVNGDTRRR